MEEMMKSWEKDELLPVNIIEEFVKRQVKKTIGELGACSCETCLSDSCAIALNALEPKYVTTTKGALLAEITATEISNQADIVAEVTKAVKKVMENPRH